MENIITNFIKTSKSYGHKPRHIHYEIMMISYLAKFSMENNIKSFSFVNNDLFEASLVEIVNKMEDGLDKEIFDALIDYNYIYCKPFVQEFYLSLIENKHIITSEEIDILLKDYKELNEVYDLAYNFLVTDNNKDILLDCSCQNDMFLRRANNKFQLKGFAPSVLTTILTTTQLKLCDRDSDIKELDIVNDYYGGKYDYVFGDMHKFAYDKKACPINEEIFMQSASLWHNIEYLYALLNEGGRMVFFVPSIALDHLKGMDSRENLLVEKALEKVIFLPRKYAVDKSFDCALLVFSNNNRKVTFIDARKHDNLSHVLEGDIKVMFANEVETLNVFD